MDIGRRKHGSGEIVSAMFRGWFDNFGQVFAVSLLFTLPIYLINAAVLSGLPDTPEDVDQLELGDVLTRTLVGGFVSVLLSFVLTAALVYAFIKVYRQETVTPGDALQGVLGSIGPILLFAVVASVLTAIGFVFLIIPGLLAIIIFSVGPPAILNEGIGGGSAISRSFQLVAGNWGITFAVVLIGLLINIVASIVVGGIAAPGALSYPTFSDFSLIRSLIQIAASALVAPIVPGLATALYFELKGRDEGFPSI
jgi:hypothetical protein